MDRTTERNLIQRVNVGDMLTRSAARAPGNVAMVDGVRRFSYAEFNTLANRTAQALAGLGLARGDALALMSTNNAEFLAVYYACAKLEQRRAHGFAALVGQARSDEPEAYGGEQQ